MQDSDFLAYGLGVTALVVLGNLLFFVALPFIVAKFINK